MNTDGNTNTDGSIKNPWNLCTVYQVEDLKILLRISPLWTSSAFLSISIATHCSLAVLQALTMDRALGPCFYVSARVFLLASITLFLPLIDQLILIPLCHNLTGWTPTPLHRLGLGHGHVLNTAAVAASALVERRKACIVHVHHARGIPNWTVRMLVMWLVLPLAATGLGEALHVPAEVTLYYQEFPKSLWSTATALVALLVGIGCYASTALVNAVRRLTAWLPDDVNEGKMENAFWMLTVVGPVNFGYYLVCATLYKNQTRGMNKEEEADSSWEHPSL